MIVLACKEVWIINRIKTVLELRTRTFPKPPLPTETSKVNSPLLMAEKLIFNGYAITHGFDLVLAHPTASHFL